MTYSVIVVILYISIYLFFSWQKWLPYHYSLIIKMINNYFICKFWSHWTHLICRRRGSEHERCSRSEEDFYYTEINQWDQPQSPTLPLSCSPASTSPASSSPSSPPSPPPPSPPSPTSPACNALSCSAPSFSGSSWQVQSEHSYQVGRGLSTVIDSVLVILFLSFHLWKLKCTNQRLNKDNPVIRK